MHVPPKKIFFDFVNFIKEASNFFLNYTKEYCSSMI